MGRITRKELEEIMLNAPQDIAGENPMLPICSVYIDNAKAHIYIVFNRRNFDFENCKLVTYDEYIQNKA